MRYTQRYVAYVNLLKSTPPDFVFSLVICVEDTYYPTLPLSVFYVQR